MSTNNFVLQLLADLTGLDVERATSTEMSILGVTFLAGLQCGMQITRFYLDHRALKTQWRSPRALTPVRI